MNKVTVDAECICGATEDWGRYRQAHGYRSGLHTDGRGNEGTINELLNKWLKSHSHNSDQERQFLRNN